jgi:uncharacterized protein YlxP (DUF503 family)
MRMVLLLYFISSLIFFFFVFAYTSLGEVYETYERNFKNLDRDLRKTRQVLRQINHLIRLKNKFNPPKDSKEKALEKLLEYVDDLRNRYQIQIKEDVKRDDFFWKIDLVITVIPKNNKDLALILSELLNTNYPLLKVNSIVVFREDGEQKAYIELSVFTTFLEKGS